MGYGGEGLDRLLIMTEQAPRMTSSWPVEKPSIFAQTGELRAGMQGLRGGREPRARRAARRGRDAVAATAGAATAVHPPVRGEARRVSERRGAA